MPDALLRSLARRMMEAKVGITIRVILGQNTGYVAGISHGVSLFVPLTRTRAANAKATEPRHTLQQ